MNRREAGGNSVNHSFLWAVCIGMVVAGCSKSPETVMEEFRVKLYAMSERWSGLEWEKCDTEFGGFNFSATYTYDGKSVFFDVFCMGKSSCWYLQV